MVLIRCKSHFYDMAKNAIIVNDCSKRFGKNIVFDQCSLAVKEGSIFGLVGLNGAGKTTLIRLLAGLLKPDAGNVTMLDSIPWNHEEQFYKRLGIVLENDGFSGNMNLVDNLMFFAVAKGLTWPAVENYVHEFWKDTFIENELHKPSKKVKHLSRGQKMQCGLCRAFLGWPNVYLFDEPTVALDVEAYDHFCGIARYAQKRGGTMLISSHQLSFVEELCDTIAILDNKKLHPLQDGSDGIEQAFHQQWKIVASDREEYKKIIAMHSGKKVAYRGDSWHFVVENPDEAIPAMIASLCAAGCRIREVREEKQELKEKMRVHYEKN
jgi:ABC-2 type transport system ATP-binding protein